MNGSTKKPKYKIPSMEEIKTIEPNGYKVVSTFAGCGGSSLGYKLAGYNVLWANEFVNHAVEIYKANHKTTIVDNTDVRKVNAEDILKTLNLKKGELDLFDGSPPCMSFSTAGKREKNWGKEKKYFDHHQVADDLFFEYIRLVKGLKPKTFVAENVSGLIKGVAKGYFKIFLKGMIDAGYKVKAYLANGKYLGVPQARQRVFYVGVRNDLKLEPVFPQPQQFVYTLKDAIWDLRNETKEPDVWQNKRPDGTPFMYAYGKEWEQLSQGQQSNKYFNVIRAAWDKPCNTILATAARSASVCHPTENRKFTIKELKRIFGFPDDFVFFGNYKEQWARLGNCVPPPMIYFISKKIQQDILDRL
tara:strand:+ start:402 stop:1478 length:1077 start_codon:yes stop_codon:yes gene_type:complete